MAKGPADVEPAGAVCMIEIIAIGIDLTEADDGAGELRKQRDVTGKFPEIARGSDDAAVGANHITGSKITTPVLGWVEDSVVRSDSPDFGVAESFSTCACTWIVG